MGELPAFEAPAGATELTVGAVTLDDVSAVGKWRSWAPRDVRLGRARRTDAGLELAVTPGEWLVIGSRPVGEDAVDLTHVRAMLRISGPGARSLLTHVCALDLGDAMTPDGAAARTLVAGVPAELVRDDVDGETSYLVLVSRSFARWMWDRLVEVAERSQEAPVS